jgi:hypothetical protein
MAYLYANMKKIPGDLDTKYNSMSKILNSVIWSGVADKTAKAKRKL